jgi:hypothetical protein
MSESLIVGRGKNALGHASIGFPACGYLLQRYLRSSYEVNYKSTVKKKTTATLTNHLTAKASLSVPPEGGNERALRAPPQGRQAPLRNTLRRVSSPSEVGHAGPPLKTALRVRFARLTPHGGYAPRQVGSPLIGLTKRRQGSCFD